MDIVTANEISVRTSCEDQHGSEKGGTVASSSVTTWQRELKTAIRSVTDLARELHIELPPVPSKVEDDFATFVPRPFLSRIQPGDCRDPLLLQVMPNAAELENTPGFSNDAVGDTESTVAGGLIRKYSGRALVIAAGSCAVNCRYCFRRLFPYEQRPISDRDWQNIFDVLESDSSVSEVILSGGDPLMLVDAKLKETVDRLAGLSHLEMLRIHSRLPVMIPSRVTQELIELLVETRLSTVFVVHVNHPNEIDRDVASALRRLRDAGITLLNQSVLLRGINDDVDTLIELSHRLVQSGCLPYYLHQLDRVTGTSHFEVPEAVGIELVDKLRRALPGYAVPRYVRETPGNPSKDVIA